MHTWHHRHSPIALLTSLVEVSPAALISLFSLATSSCSRCRAARTCEQEESKESTVEMKRDHVQAGRRLSKGAGALLLCSGGGRSIV
jgi:positive regulator of sigma E activity